MLIKEIHPKKKEFIFQNGTYEKLIPFAEILESAAWKESGVISVPFENDLGQQCVTCFAKNAFTDNIAHHLAEHRAKPEDYEQDILVYTLYRLLEGETEKSIKDEIENIVQLRITLAEKKAEGEIDSFALLMKKAVNLALDESKPEITLKNVSLEHIL